MGKGICAINARRDPGDEEGDEEEEGNASVKEGFGILLAQRDGSGDGGDAEDCWSGRSPRSLGSLRFADLNID